MRDSFAKTVVQLAIERDDIVLLSGDIGNRMFDKYKIIAPTRFLNCGIAEANMMSVASGMALCGLRPVVYTITPFTTTRCLEQIKIGVGYHNTPVIIVGTGSGLSYAELGATHHSLEDISIMRSIPGLDIYTPSDPGEVERHLRHALANNRPAYIRLGKKGEPSLHRVERSASGNSSVLRSGEDVALLGIGPILSEGLKAAELLHLEGISAKVVDVSSIRPLDHKLLEVLSDQFRLWVTLEEHSVIGGLGSLISDWILEYSEGRVRLLKLGAAEDFIHELGDQEYVRRSVGLNAETITDRIRMKMNSSKKVL